MDCSQPGRDGSAATARPLRCAAAAIGAAFPAVFAIVLVSASVGCESATPQRLSETRLVLGTAVTVTIHQTRIPRGIIDRVFARTTEIQDRMSINEASYDDTEVLRVNRAAGRDPVAVADDTRFVIAEGLRYGALTQGVFDISIAPIIKLWNIGTEAAAVPAPAAVAAALRFVDYRRVRIDDAGVFLADAGMGIDVGGIAKGFAADEAAALLRVAGVTQAILDFGGDIVSIGTRPDGTPWRVGIQHPSGERGRFLGVFASTDESVVSSGAYERFFVEDGVRYHHIFDPATGYPSTSDVTGVTVVGRSAIETDVVATTIFVIGSQRGLELAANLPGIDVIIATVNNELFINERIADRFEQRAPEYTLIRVGGGS